MKKIIFMIIFSLSCIFAENIQDKFKDPRNCVACHKEQVEQWQTSLHAHSHEDKNPLYKKMVQFVATKSFKSYEQELVNCGVCHNPRLEIKGVDDEYLIAKTFIGNSSLTSKVDNALGAAHIKNGISCYVCHNVDKILPKHSVDIAGYKAMEFTKDDTILGPYADSGRTTYHKMAQRDYFVSGNDLCLTCHQGQANENKFSTYNTGEEVAQTSDSTRCVECHMPCSDTKVIAPSINAKNAKVRNIQNHIFSGVRNDPGMLMSAIDIDFIDHNKSFKLTNLLPHRLPTGFSGRSIHINVDYDNNTKQKFILKANYVDNIGDETISYVADKLISDTRLAPLEERYLKLDIPQNTKKINISVDYYVLDPKIASLIEMSKEEFVKPYNILRREFEVH